MSGSRWTRARTCTRWTPARSRRLPPELILTQDLCRVCALPAGHVAAGTGLPRLYGRRRHPGPALPGRRAGHDPDHRPARRRRAASRAPRRRAAQQARRGRGPDRGRSRPTVAMIEWTDPPFTAGHWVPDLVTAAGGRRSPPSRASGRSDELGRHRRRRTGSCRGGTLRLRSRRGDSPSPGRSAPPPWRRRLGDRRQWPRRAPGTAPCRRDRGTRRHPAS